MEATDLELLRKEREEKIKLIAEKHRQVEELKRARAERLERQKRGGRADNHRGSDLGRNVDSLVAEILGSDVAVPSRQAAKAHAPSPEGPLRDLAGRNAEERGPSRGGDRTLKFQQEFSIAAVAVEPCQAHSYERSVQTEFHGDHGEESKSHARHPDAKLNKAPTNVLVKMAERARNRGKEAEPARPHTRAAAASQPEAKDKHAAEPEAPPVQEMSPEEREHVMNHPDFNKFFQRTTLMVERMLGQQSWDLAADFGTGDGSGKDSEAENREKMKFVNDYTEEQWARSRPVTDVRFSPHKGEMFLAAYGRRTNPALADPDGCMLVWNLAMQTRPELTFSCPSAVLTSHFHRFDPAIFFGGTYAGAVVLWDARAKSGPVLRTPLSGKGHSHPVQAMQQVGTQNATNLVTASNDGRLCVWSLAMMNLPQETVDLKNETKKMRDPAVMCLAFPENETNTLYVGAEDGSICQVHIHGSKTGVTELYDGHEGPVTGIDMRPHHGSASQHEVDSSVDLALSCSFDWSVRLWNVKQHQAPILSLDCFEDYVYDVRWHPTHPGVFSSVDGEGHVDLWNLNANLESPVVRCENPNQRKLALNHCHWSMDGRKLVTGDSEGTLSVYAVDRSVAQPRNEDFQLFQERIRQLQPIVSRGARDGYGGLDTRFAPLPRH